MKAHQWRVQATADALGISRPALYKIIAKSDRLRTAADLDPTEISACHERFQGDTAAMAEAWRSPSGHSDAAWPSSVWSPAGVDSAVIPRIRTRMSRPGRKPARIRPIRGPASPLQSARGMNRMKNASLLLSLTFLATSCGGSADYAGDDGGGGGNVGFGGESIIRTQPRAQLVIDDFNCPQSFRSRQSHEIGNSTNRASTK